MTARMNVIPSDASEVSVSQEPNPEGRATPVSVVAAVTVVAGVDPQPTVEAVGRQGHPLQSVRLIGAADTDAPTGVVQSADLEAIVAELDPTVDYVWILHGDAEPRPDALGALVAEAERFEASLAGSKLLVAGTPDTLEGVGSATDVFGEPYSGLDEGEVDLEQYDVVRDVAFVSSVSMLVRRDLLRGLRGLDSVLAPVAAGLDLSQRVRIAGGRVIVVPSSEVFHRGRCGRGDGGWREQAGRMRAMIKSYRPITLAWFLPFAVLTGVLDSIVSLLLGRWRVLPRYLFTWAWNIVQAPSTIAARRGLARVRQVGDEELFRYQVGGAVRLRQAGSELSERFLGMFDEDSGLTTKATEVWNSAVTWGMVAALGAVLVGLRAIFLSGLPVVGHALPLPEDPVTTLDRFAGGWNPAGLGTAAPVHPGLGPVATVQLLLGGEAGLTRSLVTLAAFGASVLGMGRLASKLGVGGPGAYLGGVAASFGLAAGVLAREGRWTALIAVGLMPWALVSVLGPPLGSRRELMGAIGRTVAVVALITCFVPWLGPVPLLFAVGVRLIGRFRSRPVVAAVGSLGMVVALPYVAWRMDETLGGVPIVEQPRLIAMAFLLAAVVTGMLAGSWRASGLAGLMAFGGLAVSKAVGPDLQEALLVLAAVGVGLATASALRPRSERGVISWLALASGIAVLVVSLVGLGGGRGGLAPDAWGRELAFMGMAAEGAERALLVAPDPSLLPGESRQGPGFWYRLIDSGGPTLDQVALGPAAAGDAALRTVLDTVASGASLEPGADLARFGIRWVVLAGEPGASLAAVLDSQIDLRPLPLSERLSIYENEVPAAVAQTEDGDHWVRDGTGFAGQPVDQRVLLALNGNSRWGPDWQAEDWAGSVSGRTGRATFPGVPAHRSTILAGVAVFVAGAGLAVWARWGR